jgi:hypothetical protein
MEPLYILISGTRNNLNDEHRKIIQGELEKINVDVEFRDMSPTLIHGDCDGVDKFASSVATQLRWSSIAVPAQWHLYGKKAGPIRNQQMIDIYIPHIFLAFPSLTSRGTFDCIQKVHKYHLSPSSRLIRLIKIELK